MDGWRINGWRIKGSRCPNCNEQVIYNGNYFCSYCSWVLPEFPRREKDKHAFNLSYALLMKQTEREPDTSVFYRDKDGHVL